MIRVFLVFAAGLVLGIPGAVSAQTAANTDPSFETGSLINGSVQCVVPVQGDKFYIGGAFTTVRGALRNQIARLNADGSVDDGFDPGSGANNRIETMVVQADGKVIIGGWFTRYDGAVRNRLARLNADGSLDTSFDPGLGLNGVVASLALQSDGKVLIGGWFTSCNGVARNYVARLNADGSLDPGFNPGSGASSGVVSMAVLADGKVLIGGHFTTYNGTASPYLARLNPDGSPDAGFDVGAGANGPVSSLGLQADGKALVGGSFTSFDGVGRNRIARVDTDGNLDVTFDPGTGANGTVTSLALQADGKVLLGGWFTGFNGTARGYVARLDAGGSLDPGFDPGSGAESLVFCVAVRGDGKALIGGQFKSFAGTSLSHVARLNADGSLDAGLEPSTGANGGVSSMGLQGNGKLVIVGDFTSFDGIDRSRVARLGVDGSLDAGFDPGDGAQGAVSAVAVLAEDKLIIAGDFTSYDGTVCGRIARLNPDGSLDPGFDAGVGADGPIDSIVVQADGKVIVVGDFTSFGGIARGRIARVDADGSLDLSFNPGVGANAPVSCVALQADGKVLVGGDFTGYDGTLHDRVVRLNSDGSLDATFNPGTGANDLVSCLLVQPDGKVLLGGDFTTFNLFARERIVRLTPDGSLDPVFDPGVGANGLVQTLALQVDGKVFVGGGFTSLRESNRQNIARLNADGSIDPAFEPESGTNGTVTSLALQRDGKVLAGGDFTTYNGTACGSLVRVINSASVLGLTAPSQSRVEWMLAATAPEVEQVVFDHSLDGNVWTLLGNASRVSGGWKLDGAGLAAAGYLRARGRSTGGLRNGSSSQVEQVASYYFPPEIAVEQPVGMELANGTDEVDFGSVAFGGSNSLTFTIRNNGISDLLVTGLSLSGSNPEAFSVSDEPDTTVIAAGTTTFTILFDAASPGVKDAVLEIANNDPEQSVFEIPLTGTMLKGVQTIVFDPIGDQLATASVELDATGGASGNPVNFSVDGPAQLAGATLTFTGPGLVTVTANQAGSANYEPAAPVVRSFTVTAALALVTLENLEQVYDGSPRTASASTFPPGLPVAIDYGGPAPVNAGSYPVSASVSDPRYVGAKIGILVIAKASQGISFPAIGDQVATDEIGLSATGGGSGNAVVFTSSGPSQIGGNNLLTFTGPGSVTVRANQVGGPNHEAATEVAHTFAVSAADATLSLSRLHQVADGTVREVLVSTDPPGLEVEVTYEGAPGAPTGVGSYAVVATPTDARYEGTVNGTLIVDDPSRMEIISGGGLPALSALGALSVPTFQIGAYEVTGSQWSAIVAWAEAQAGYNFGGAGAAALGDHPVTGVSWFDAAKWCNARTEWENALLGLSLAPAYRVSGNVFKTGNPSSPADLVCDFGVAGYRLPTAGEWEFAARGGSGGSPSLYPGGGTLEPLGWYVGNSDGGPHPAGGKLPNGLDLYDFPGNAAEWTWDAPSGAPAQRLLRGGAWSSAASACEIASLLGESPSPGLNRSGLRLARSVSQALAAALDDPGLAWETAGAALWVAGTATTHDGVDAAGSSSLSQGQSTWLETEVEGPGNLRFRWKTTGTEAQDLLVLSIDGNETLGRSGPVDWEERIVEIAGGEHLLRWSFARGSVSGIARAWLDTVAFTPATPPIVNTAAATSVTGISATLGGEVSGDGGREVTVRGVVYSTDPDPTLENGVDLPAAAGGTGSFNVAATGLTEGTTYFVRAYATNNLGTTYGDQVVFTCHTNVVFTDGLADYTRDLLPGDRHRYNFVLSGPRIVSLSSMGGAALRAELRNSAGDVLATFAGDADFDLEEGLIAGGHILEIYRLEGSGPAQGYTVTFDASVVASTRPDVATGASMAGLSGRDVFLPSGQSVSLTSIKAKPITAYAELANRGNLPDVISGRAGGGDAFFNVVYSSGGGNVTAGLLSGTYRTAAIEGGDAGALIQVSVSPNKKKVSKKKGKRTKILKKSLTLTITATSTFDPVSKDAASITVQTR